MVMILIAINYKFLQSIVGYVLSFGRLVSGRKKSENRLRTSIE